MQKVKLDELNRLSKDEFAKADKNNFVIVLDNVRSMNNVGSVFRTADAFLASSIYICGITATPPHREIQKTALGATETVTWAYHEETALALKQLKELGYKIYALEQTAESILLHNFKPMQTEKYAFVLGNEVEGVSVEALTYCDGSIEIPQYGSKHSLNVSVACGILAWDFVAKCCI